MKVCLVGAGHIGLPTACIIADKGYEVIATDIDQTIVDNINSGECHITENGLTDLLTKVHATGRLKASTDVIGSVRQSDVAIIIVPTPLTPTGPNMDAINTATKAVGKGLKKGMLVIMESTVYPGTTSSLIKETLEHESGLKADEDFYLAYSPERAIPTRTIEEIRTNNRIVGPVGKASGEKAKEFYSKVLDAEITVMDSSTTAEFVKIAENIYRDVNIALANEFASVAEKLNIDISQVIEAANKHPRVSIHKPGAGVGGHCIPKDPYFLINKAREMGISTPLIETARQINEKMPEKIVSLVEEGLSSINKKIEGSKISVLGFAYKGDTSDTRGTPSERIIKGLKGLGGDVHVHDSLAKSANGIKIETDLHKTLSSSDCIVLATDHSEYRNINIPDLAKEIHQPAIFIDGRNIFDRQAFEKAGIKYYGIGK